MVQRFEQASSCTSSQEESQEPWDGQQPEGEPNEHLYVNCIPEYVRPEEIHDHFARFGRCFVSPRYDSFQSLAFCYVTFEKRAGLRAALAHEGPHLVGRAKTPIGVRIHQATIRKEPSVPHELKKMFVGGLPPKMKESGLREFFEEFGDLEECYIIYDERWRRSRGFGFVSFRNEAITDSFCAQKYVEVQGKLVECRLAEPKSNPNALVKSEHRILGSPQTRRDATSSGSSSDEEAVRGQWAKGGEGRWVQGQLVTSAEESEKRDIASMEQPDVQGRGVDGEANNPLPKELFQDRHDQALAQNGEGLQFKCDGVGSPMDVGSFEGCHDRKPTSCGLAHQAAWSTNDGVTGHQATIAMPHPQVLNGFVSGQPTITSAPPGVYAHTPAGAGAQQPTVESFSPGSVLANGLATSVVREVLQIPNQSPRSTGPLPVSIEVTPPTVQRGSILPQQQTAAPEAPTCQQSTPLKGYPENVPQQQQQMAWQPAPLQPLQHAMQHPGWIPVSSFNGQVPEINISGVFSSSDLSAMTQNFHQTTVFSNNLSGSPAGKQSFESGIGNSGMTYEEVAQIQTIEQAVSIANRMQIILNTFLTRVQPLIQANHPYIELRPLSQCSPQAYGPAFPMQEHLFYHHQAQPGYYAGGSPGAAMPLGSPAFSPIAVPCSPMPQFFP